MNCCHVILCCSRKRWSWLTLWKGHLQASARLAHSVLVRNAGSAKYSCQMVSVLLQFSDDWLVTCRGCASNWKITDICSVCCNRLLTDNRFRVWRQRLTGLNKNTNTFTESWQDAADVPVHLSWRRYKAAAGVAGLRSSRVRSSRWLPPPPFCHFHSTNFQASQCIHCPLPTPACLH